MVGVRGPRPSGTDMQPQGRGGDSDRRRGGWLAGLIIAVPLAALLAFVVYCATLGGSAAWSALGVHPNTLNLELHG